MMGAALEVEPEMEALAMTVGLLIVIVGALVLLARTWPHSSRRTGYRISGQDAAAQEPPEMQRAVPEDDDVRWHWRGGSR